MGNTRVAVFFDVPNLYHSSKLYGGAKISYKDLLAKIIEGRELSVAKAYAAYRNEKDVGSFHKALKASNIEVITKRIPTRKDPNNADKPKLLPVHFDVEIATDALMASIEDSQVQTVVLCTGNGNFDYLVDALTELKISVEIWSFEESTSKALIENAKFVPIPKSCLLPEKETPVLPG